MSYADPKTITYTRSAAVTDATWAITPPYGCSRARIVDIQASVTTTYNAVTTSATVGVGVAGNTSVMGELDFATTAAGSTVGLKDSWVRLSNPTYATVDLTGASNTITGTPAVPEVLGPVLITFTANTGGTPAGAAVVDVTLDWF